MAATDGVPGVCSTRSLWASDADACAAPAGGAMNASELSAVTLLALVSTGASTLGAILLLFAREYALFVVVMGVTLSNLVVSSRLAGMTTRAWRGGRDE